jgi:uncharacterized repeat protein (TIGR03803 family)
MKNQGFWLKIFLGAACALAMFPNKADAAAKASTILLFDQKNGSQPRSGLVTDTKGNLYGATSAGGNSGCGLVFELLPASGGSWREKIIYTFKGGPADTCYPYTNLILDGHGNLFGGSGGSDNSSGAIFELTPSSSGSWTEKILYTFSDQAYAPGAQLAFDKQGNLYGSVGQTPTAGDGGVFKLSPQPGGDWTETLIYNFTGSNGDGDTPAGGVVLDNKGDVYGTTISGGSLNRGTVYRLNPNKSGGFDETILYNFTGQTDGEYPYAPLTIDAKGNLFGTTSLGGPVDHAYGVVFELSQSGGKWSETILYNFGGMPDGYFPSGVVFDAKGNLYGATQNGGAGCNSPGCGIAFELTPQTKGLWKETILHAFESAGDGSQSVAGVVVNNANGYVYGTTAYGGSEYGYGTVFEIQP